MRTGMALVAMLMASACIVMPAQGETVLDIRQVELFPDGRFTENGAWAISGAYGYGNDPLRHSNAWIENDSLRIEHDRSVNSRTVTVWSGVNTTSGHESATGEPDGAYTTSNGPEIVLTDFDTVSFEGKPVLEARVFLSMQVPVRLSDDEVRLLMDNGTGGAALLHTWFHTETPINALDNPYWSMQIDVTGLTSFDVGSLAFTVDYASKGGQDDSELRLDALGLQITYQQIANGVEFVRTSTTHELPMLPWIDIEPEHGLWSGFVADPCGLSVDMNATSSIWNSPLIELPPGQSVGRIWIDEEGNSSLWWRVAESEESWQLVPRDASLGADQSIELQLEMLDGCFDGLRVDFNEPKVVVRGQMSGDITAIDTSLSSIAIVIDGETVVHTMFTVGTFEVQGPAGGILSDEEMVIEIVARFQWADDGSPNSFSVLVEGVEITGGFEYDIDEDPVCDDIPDFTLLEDGAAKEFDMALRCSDDRDAMLSYNVLNSHPSVVSATISGTEIVIEPVPEASGSTVITIIATDESGNTDVLDVEVVVSEVADPPIVGRSGLPSTVYVEVGVLKQAQLTISDIDTALADLTWMSTSQWVSVSETGLVSILAGAPFDGNVFLNVTDGTHQSNISFRLNATLRPDLTVSELITTPSTAQEGDLISIRATITNLGEADARQFWLSCTVNDQPLDRATMFGLLGAGNSTTHTLEWEATGSNEMVTISCVIDELDHIRESDEQNNQAQISLNVLSIVPENTSVNVSSEADSKAPTYGLVITGVLVLLGICYLILGPDRIRKVR